MRPVGDPALAVELARPWLETGKQQIEWLRLCKVEPDRFRGRKVRESDRARSGFCH